MKLIDLLLAAMLLSLSAAMLSGSVKELHKLEHAISETEDKAASIHFISESFKFYPVILASSPLTAWQNRSLNSLEIQYLFLIF